jgi:hypothetical protein
MIIKGGARGRSKDLARHLLRADQNERIQVYEIRGLVGGDVESALWEMETHGLAAQSTRPLYHASISPEAHTPLSPGQVRVAVDTLEAALGFERQPRIVLIHEKKGREHVHVVWSRVDIDRGRVASDSWNYRAHEQAARTLEAAFGHRPISSSDSKKPGREAKRTLDEYELRQEERSGRTASIMTSEITDLWNEASDGQEFRKMLEKGGFRLARGDRRAFVVIDRHGEVHSLARRIQGSTPRQIHKRMAPIDLSSLPSVESVRRGKLELGNSEPVRAFKPVALALTSKSSATLGQRDMPVRETFSRATVMTRPDYRRCDTLPMRVSTLAVRIQNYRTRRLSLISEFTSKLASVQQSSDGHARAAMTDALLSERDAALDALAREELDIARSWRVAGGYRSRRREKRFQRRNRRQARRH